MSRRVSNLTNEDDGLSPRIHSEWTRQREYHLRTWVIQMARAATIMDRAASWMERIRTCFVVLSQFCSAYTSIIPVSTLGCQIVEGETCKHLQLSGIAVAVIGSILALLEGKIDPGNAATRLSVGAKNIMQLARRVDLMLQRDYMARLPVDQFSENIASEYDAIMQNIPQMPRFIFNSHDLVNITLLGAYIDSDETPSLPPLGEVLRERIRREYTSSTNNLNSSSPP